MISKNIHIPLYIQLKDEILKQIAAGKYSENSQLPTEKELMAIYGLGRATVRAALGELEHEGRIIKRRGVGTFVSQSNKAAGFEPLISLSYALDRLGIQGSSKTVCSKPVRPEGDMLEKWSDSMWVHYIKRIRCANETPIAIEESCFVNELYNIVRRLDSSDSVAHAILSSNITIDKIEQTILIRQPVEEEAEKLSVAPGDNVVELLRWIYKKGESYPASRVKFVMPEAMLEFPFAALEKR